MFSLRVQKSIQKPSKFGFKNPWKFEHHLCQLKVNMLHFWSQKAIKMRSKILENQVRSGQLSSGHVFGQQATSPRPVWKGRGTQRHSRMCLQWKTHPVHKYWVQPDASCHQWGFCDDMFQPRQPGHVFNTFNFQGFSHSLFPNIHLKSFPSASMFISKCCKCILTNKLLTQRGLPFSSPWEAWKHEKWWKIGWKTMKIQGLFKSFKFAVFLGYFTTTWGSLDASLGCPEASWRCLGAS